MNRRDLVEIIADDAQLTKTQASRALESFVNAVQDSLRRGDRVALSGFGTFALGHRRERRVRDPRTGATMRIPARRVARFTPGLDLKHAVGSPTKQIPLNDEEKNSCAPCPSG